MAETSGRVTFSGPFFTKDPRKTFRRNVRGFMEKLAEEGERDVKSQIAAAEGRMRHSTGRTQAHVRGRTKSLAGRQWEVSAVVSVDTSGMSRKEAIRTRAAAASIEGRFHPFRRTTASIKRARREHVEALLKGIA